MTGRVFIEERIIEEVSASSNGGTGRNECDFSEMGGAFVRVNQFLEDGFIPFCTDFDDPSILKGDIEIFDQAAAVAERKGRLDSAFGALTIGQGENFLGRHIGREDNSI